MVVTVKREVVHGRVPTLVHPVCVVLAAGLASVGRLSVCVAHQFAISYYRHHADRSFRLIECDSSPSGALAAGTKSDLGKHKNAAASGAMTSG